MLRLLFKRWRPVRPLPRACNDTEYGFSAETQRKLLRVAINACTTTGR